GRERGRRPAARSDELLDGQFDGLWIVVASVDDENVLEATRNVDLSVEQVAEIPGAQPPARLVETRRARRVRIVPVAGSDRRAAEADLSHDAIGKDAAVFVLDGQLVARKRRPAADELDGGAVRGGRRLLH